MAEQNNGATPGQGITPPATPPAAPAANQPGNPPANGNSPASGGKTEGEKVHIPFKSMEEYNNMVRDAGRYRSRNGGNTPTPNERREQRYSPPASGDNDDPEVARLMAENQQTKAENMRLSLNLKVKDLLVSDEYKDLPATAKRILEKNPLAFVDPRAKNVDDAILDIQDWIESELDLAKASSGNTTPATPGQPAGNGQTPAVHETPPVNGVGQPGTTPSQEESTEGKTGPSRSTTILRNLFKKSVNK